jgi:hypothetical protein
VGMNEGSKFLENGKEGLNFHGRKGSFWGELEEENLNREGREEESEKVIVDKSSDLKHACMGVSLQRLR